MIIDWKRFAERVPAGTMIYVVPFRVNGILLESYPYHILDDNAEMRARCDFMDGDNNYLNPNYLRYHMIDQASSYMDISIDEPSNFDYFIDGQWLTFAEVMR